MLARCAPLAAPRRLLAPLPPSGFPAALSRLAGSCKPANLPSGTTHGLPHRIFRLLHTFPVWFPYPLTALPTALQHPIALHQCAHRAAAAHLSRCTPALGSCRRPAPFVRRCSPPFPLHLRTQFPLPSSTLRDPSQPGCTLHTIVPLTSLCFGLTSVPTAPPFPQHRLHSVPAL
ncbi:hypothetical protein B0H10DRAFT_2211274 [Mycena sp. CBHHK59/15]|nr:hypothetical protein B0H10DRAFT_2211274 [Mycena sp. CBHHK59/15]